MTTVCFSRLVLFAVIYACAGLASSGVGAFSSSVPSTETTKSGIFSSHFDNESLSPNTAALTYLEINGWLVSTGGLTILIDPILEGALDFGIPKIYSARKRVLSSSGLCQSLPPIDCMLITQGWDDHAHERTLKKLKQLDESIPVIAPPSAKGALEKSGFTSDTSNISFVRPGDDITVASRFCNSNRADHNDATIKIRATTGALVGPPWQARENGYIISSAKGPKIYIEPHVEYNVKEISREGPVHIVITPISGQGLAGFELVHGPDDALRLVESLSPKYILPMQNGDVDAEGLISGIIKSVGTPNEFQTILERVQKSKETKSEVVSVIPGEDILLTI
mmetsp:Transcript_22479/g.31345  ORF Transcript_22479/g.31345 Transcript_22479/m.31345 type:complete len:338 (+) Transcript_22479:95-1108(+)